MNELIIYCPHCENLIPLSLVKQSSDHIPVVDSVENDMSEKEILELLQLEFG